MGSGRWSVTTYHGRATDRRAAGKDTFDYNADAMRTGNLRPHQTLDPQGLRLRESRDNAEHPNSNAVIISLDVTGSMSAVVRGIHQDLPRLLELLLGHKFLPDPQICFAAVGDATCDAVPLQVGQFESDNRMDQNLENMILEGGGGGQDTESYELMLYVGARHTAMDCWEKRQRKGYLFMIGDEMAYSAVKRREVQRLLGPTAALQADIPLDQLIAEVREKFHVYYIIPGGASHGDDPRILKFWQSRLGPQYVLQLEDPADTSESIALTIGATEGKITPGQPPPNLQRPGLFDRLTGALATLWSGPTVNPDRARHL
jgi:hypothetical protein